MGGAGRGADRGVWSGAGDGGTAPPPAVLAIERVSHRYPRRQAVTSSC
jgi:hypothetical protein